MTIWWLSSPAMTFGVKVDANKIVLREDCPPIIKKFIGQPLSNLLRWMQPDVKVRLNG